MIIEDPFPRDCELVVGLVAPIGTAVDEVIEPITRTLTDYGYGSEVIRLSSLLEETTVGGPHVLAGEDGDSYYSDRMDAGDRLRRQFAAGDALAAYVVSTIVHKRHKATSDPRPNRRFAWILRTLKHPKEVALLRTVYGRRFLLIGVTAPETDRIEYLADKMNSSTKSKSQGLIERDEKDERDPYGQQVRATFSLADSFLEVSRGRSVSDDAERIVRLIFGEPFLTPTYAEQAMFHAQASALRSSAFGRQVGAVLADRRGSILATGTNEVPRPGGGEYWAGDDPDHRDFAYHRDFNRAKTLKVTADVLGDLINAGWLKDDLSKDPNILAKRALRKDMDGSSVLGDSRLRSLIEFGRIAHAEMSAVSDAARRGVSTQESILYTTTYPCHMCARIIINAGIRQVVYIDPYAKSLIGEMYGDLVNEGSQEDSSRVRFTRFVGISPRLFPIVFAEANRTVDEGGQHLPPDRHQARLRLAEGDTLAGAAVIENEVVNQLRAKVEEIQVANGC